MTSIGKCSEGVLQLSQGPVKSPVKAEVWRRERMRKEKAIFPSASGERNGTGRQ